MRPSRLDRGPPQVMPQAAGCSPLHSRPPRAMRRAIVGSGAAVANVFAGQGVALAVADDGRRLRAADVQTQKQLAAHGGMRLPAMGGTSTGNYGAVRHAARCLRVPDQLGRWPRGDELHVAVDIAKAYPWAVAAWAGRSSGPPLGGEPGAFRRRARSREARWTSAHGRFESLAFMANIRPAEGWPGRPGRLLLAGPPRWPGPAARNGPAAMTLGPLA